MRRSQYIDAPDVERSVRRHHRSGDGAAMDDRVEAIAVEQLIDLPRIGDVASAKTGDIHCGAPEIAGRHGRAGLRQSSDQRGADEATRSGDQNAPEVTL